MSCLAAAATGDVDALQKLFSDAKITAEMNAQWLKSRYITRALRYVSCRGNVEFCKWIKKHVVNASVCVL